MRLALVISSLGGGGAERVMTRLANGWVARGVDVRLLTLDASGSASYWLDPRVRRADVVIRGSFISVQRVRQRVAALRGLLREISPDAIISFGDRTNVQALLAARRLGAPVLVSERTDPRMVRSGRAWSALRRWTYPKAAGLVVQTRRVAEWASTAFPRVPTTVIPNPVDLPRPGDVARQPVLLAAGRLGPEKGFDLLLRSFASISDRWPEWRLEIVGDGPQRSALVALARDLGIDSRTSFPGFVDDLAGRLASAGIFVLSSRFEGFPNVLIEALAQGTAVVAADCPSGPAEIVTDGVDGRLVPVENVAALARTLEELLAAPAERKRLGSAGLAVHERFRLTHVLDLWEDTLRRSGARRAESARPGGKARAA